MYFFGIDIAKKFHESAIIDEQGKVVVKRIKFQNSHSDFCKLMESVRKLNQPVEFASKATGHFSRVRKTVFGYFWRNFYGTFSKLYNT